jgi:LacI family transcriptional regulator
VNELPSFFGRHQRAEVQKRFLVPPGTPHGWSGKPRLRLDRKTLERRVLGASACDGGSLRVTSSPRTLGGLQVTGESFGPRRTSDVLPRRAYALVVQAERQATLTEVAQLAGVSLTTASKAVNGRARVSEVTRQRVIRAARELSYAPNLVARSLASGRSSTIGVLIRDPSVHRIAMPIVIGAESMLQQRQLSAIIADARGVVDRLADLAAMLRQRNVDGLLIVGDNQGQTPSITAAAKIPSVYVHGQTTNPRDVVHLVDDFAGGVAIINHLIEVGRARIAHITGPEYSPAVQQRVLGVGHALDEHGLQLVGDVSYGRWSQRWARQATREVLADAPDLDAIACGSDQIAAAVVETVIASGRKVPDDVAITGYDNWLVFAEETDPALTTIDLNLEELGVAAVNDLFAMINGARVGGGTRYHEGTLIIRGSTGRHVS